MIPNFTNTLFTYVLENDTLDIVADYGIDVVALKLVSGSATFKGTRKLGAIESTPISLVADDPVTVSLGQNIEHFIIDASSGVVNIIAA